jgi:hypothetical protein
VLVAGFKFVHDLTNCEITGHIDIQATGGPAFIVAGTNAGTVGCSDIDIWGGTYSELGTIPLTGPTVVGKGFISTDGGSASFQPHRIRWHGPRVKVDGNCPYILNMQNGTSFQLEDVEVVGTVGTSLCTIVTGSLTDTKFTLRKRSLVRAALTSNVTPGSGTTALVFGTELEDINSEFASGIFTAQRPMQVIVTASCRTATLAAGKNLTISVVANGTNVGQQEYVNAGTGGVEASVLTTVIVDLKPGQTVQPFVTTNDASAVISGTAAEALTRIQIQEIG